MTRAVNSNCLSSSRRDAQASSVNSSVGMPKASRQYLERYGFSMIWSQQPGDEREAARMTLGLPHI